MNPKVSIVMRSCNDIKYIEKTLEMVFRQEFTDFELINVDSGSTDGTFDIVRKFNPDKSYQIAAGEYVPGKVLNDAVKKCQGEIIVFNNSDCIPCDKFWLGNLVSPIIESKAVAVYGKQMPRPTAKPLVQKDNLRAFSEVSQGWFHFFSLATSAILKDELVKYPFSNDLQYSEDIDWSYKAKQRGSVVVFADNARVEHSHDYTMKEIKRRFYGEGFAEGAIYGARGVGDGFFLKVLKPVFAETVRDMLYLVRQGHISEMLRSPIYRWQQRYWTYKGLQDYFKCNNNSRY